MLHGFLKSVKNHDRRKMFKYLFFFAILVIHVHSNEVPPDNEGTPAPTINNTEVKARLDQGSIALTGKFIYQLSQIKPNDNFVTSATSILILLAEITLFAQNTALKQLLTTLNLNNKEEIKSIYPEEIDGYKNQQEVIFELANICYANEDYQLTDEFKNQTLQYFDSPSKNIDFVDNVAAAKEINDWVSERTRDKINNLVPADALSANTIMVLINAMYFKGNWVHQFNENVTAPRNFTRRDNTVVELPTMYQENTFKYYDNNQGVKAIELPYKGNNFSLFIILPDIDKYDETIQNLQNPNEFTTIRNNMAYQKVRLYLPKIKIETSSNLVQMLKKVGLTAIFDASADSFTDILVDDKPLYVSDVLQKGFIEWNELGSEAAVATALGVATLSLPSKPPPVFNADHPLLYYIVYQNTILFCGAFVG